MPHKLVQEQLPAIGVLKEMKLGRDKLFVHPNLINLLKTE